MYIEFVGAPGSGKTFFFKKLTKFFNEKKIQFETPKDVFINLYLKKKTNSLKIKKYLFQYYFKHFNPYSNFLFKKESTDLKLFIQKEIRSSKKIRVLVEGYKNFIKDRFIPRSLLNRMIFNFKIDCIGIIKKNNNSKILIAEEGIYQKFYLNFKSQKLEKKKIDQNFLKIFNTFKNPKIIFFFNYNIKSSMSRTKKRKNGFKYFINKQFLLDDKYYFNDYLIEFAKKKKINILNVYYKKKLKVNLNENFTRRLF